MQAAAFAGASAWGLAEAQRRVGITKKRLPARSGSGRGEGREIERCVPTPPRMSSKASIPHLLACFSLCCKACPAAEEP